LAEWSGAEIKLNLEKTSVYDYALVLLRSAKDGATRV
jgi:hypothetical protein